MKTDILATAAALSDQDLLVRLEALAGKEREASVELVAHIAALDTRPALYAAQGYGSLFSYCTGALRLSEDAACNRIEAARASRRFPLILGLLASGSLSLTSVRILQRHLTPENHAIVLGKAKGRSRREIDVLVAELAPQPDVPTSVRRLPTQINPSSMPPFSAVPAKAVPIARFDAAPSVASPFLSSPPTRRPIVQATAPERYGVQFTIGQETHEKLRRLQALLRREIPDGDPGAIFDRALNLLLEKVEKTKLGAAAKPRPRISIRPGTDNSHKPGHRSRYIPREVKRAVWRRDGGQCAFVSANGRRCRDGTYLEFHHRWPHAKEGPATTANISLRCRRHNQYEAEVIFGLHGAWVVRGREPFVPGAMPAWAFESRPPIPHREASRDSGT